MFAPDYQDGSPHARYMIVDSARGSWTATLRTVAYDWDAAARMARENGRPDWAHALATGYAAR